LAWCKICPYHTNKRAPAPSRNALVRRWLFLILQQL
jgi:hypothetical protein